MIKYHVQGTPVAQPRPRHNLRSGVYTPKKCGIKGWKKLIILETHLNIKETIRGPVRLELMFYMPRPKSHFGEGRNATRIKDSSPVYHTQTPDLDNLAKAVMDALTTARVWIDDSQVMILNCSKYWAIHTEPGVKISISEA